MGQSKGRQRGLVSIPRPAVVGAAQVRWVESPGCCHPPARPAGQVLGEGQLPPAALSAAAGMSMSQSHSARSF